MFGHENGKRKMIQVDQRCRFFFGGKSELLLSEAVRTGESASSRAGVWMPGSWRLEGFPIFFVRVLAILGNQVTRFPFSGESDTHGWYVKGDAGRLQNPKASTPSSPPESPSEGGNHVTTRLFLEGPLKVVVQYGSVFVLFSNWCEPYLLNIFHLSLLSKTLKIW